jgi:cytochrome c biogenesis protein CcmG, thiol:disulfide interchange protein DsbE
MRTNKKLFIFSYIILVLLSWTTATYAEQHDPVPAFNLPTLSATHLTDKTLRGQVTLLHVWGTWCHYCRDEHTMLMTIKKSGVPIYGISLKDTMPNVRQYLNANGNPFTLDGFDIDGRVSDALGIYGTPQTYVVDKKGIIRYSYSGGIDSSAWQGTFLPLIQKLRKEN